MKPVIAIHGVGNPEPGSVITDLDLACGADAVGSCQTTSLEIAGREYPTLTRSEGTPAFVEVNWSDVRRPLSGIFGVVRRVWYLFLAMLAVGDRFRGDKKPRVRYSATTVYRLVVELYVVWAMALPAYSLLLIVSSRNGRIAATAGFVAAALFFTWLYRRMSLFWGYGLLWTILYGFVGGVAIGDGQLVNHIVVYGVAKAHEFGQFAAAITLAVAAAQVLLLPGGAKGFTARLSRLGFLYAPLFAVACVGPAMLGVVMFFVEPGVASDWTKHFKECLDYDPVVAELILTSGLAFIGVSGLLGYAGYRFGNPKTKGKIARKWLRYLLVVSPLVMVAAGIVFGVPKIRAAMAIPEIDLYDVYRYTSLRIVPFLPLFLGRPTLILDVLGDAVFYLLPRRHKLSIRMEVQDRFRAAVDELVTRHGQRDLVILAHSQGSVIAADVLETIADGSFDLITLGSPIDSLYKTFLGRTVAPGITEADPRVRWTNLYRSDDYIGGRISRAEKYDDPIGVGGHENYWSDPLVIGELSRAAGYSAS